MACDREPYVSRNALIQIVTSIPTAPWPDIMQGMILALLRARQYCYLQSPYFMPTERMLFAFANGSPGGSGRAFDDTGAHGQAVPDVGFAFVSSRRDACRSEGVPLSERFPALQDVGV